MITSITAWLQRHDLTLDLITVWALALGFGLFGLVKLMSWWTLRKQADQTMVGVSLKKQKLGEMFLGFGMATLYSMTLFAYYIYGTPFGFWERLAVRAGLVVAVVFASYHGVLFGYHLWRESRGGRTGPIPLVREED